MKRTPTGHQFTLFAPNAKQIDLCVNVAAAHTPFTELFAMERRTGHDEERSCWSREVSGLPDAFEYVYRIDRGPELVDPYARCLTGGEIWGDRSWEARGLSFRPYRSFFSAERAMAPGSSRPPRPQVADGERVIYELHVRGFTRHASSRVAHPGTYLGLIEKIPYLRALGVTTVELLPLFEFDETENRRRNPRTGERLLNYWGYSPVSFFAPKASYAVEHSPGAAQRELAAMVDALHTAGIEVVLDVVYNHTAEGGGGTTDPLHSLRGLAEDVCYLKDPATGLPLDVTGCGNTVNTNHPFMRRLILDSLRYWAEEIGVDGFRFDLAAVFYRGLLGEKLASSPIAVEIAADPVLAERLLIAEPWDVSGFTPPAGFPHPWREWNGAFRDDMRRLVRGDAVASRTVALRLAGSPDLFPPPHTRSSSIDFVTCHDGFPLADLVSYEAKRNLENGEENRDGSTFNLSSNHGVEGETNDPAILAVRDRQASNLLALLLVSRGTPMLLAGDERGRTQHGNNNAWCQDNELSWVEWGQPETGEAGREAFVRRLIELRRELAPLAFAEWSVISPLGSPREAGSALLPTLLLTRDRAGATTLALAINPTGATARFPLPRSPGGRPWRLRVDSFTDGVRAANASAPRELAAGTSELDVQPKSIRLLLA